MYSLTLCYIQGRNSQAAARGANLEDVIGTIGHTVLAHGISTRETICPKNTRNLG